MHGKCTQKARTAVKILPDVFICICKYHGVKGVERTGAEFDAVRIGAGHTTLAAALYLAAKGWRIAVFQHALLGWQCGVGDGLALRYRKSCPTVVAFLTLGMCIAVIVRVILRVLNLTIWAAHPTWGGTIAKGSIAAFQAWLVFGRFIQHVVFEHTFLQPIG